jgi:hypothetical protein
VLCNMEEVGIRVYHMPSSPTTIATKKVWRWHHLRCYMVIGVELHCFGMRLENGRFLDPTFLQEAEKEVCMVRENLRVTQSRQKSYADHKRRELSFEVRDFVYLKVSPMRGLRHFKV